MQTGASRHRMSRRQTAVYEHRRHGHGSSDCARKLGADPRLSCANCHPQRGSRESGPLREASAGYRACPSKRRVLSIRAADACGSRQRMYCSIVNNSRAMRPHCPYRNRSARLERLPESESAMYRRKDVSGDLPSSKNLLRC